MSADVPVHKCQRYGDGSVFFRADCPACRAMQAYLDAKWLKVKRWDDGRYPEGWNR